MGTTIASWRSAFVATEAGCPWPGPRPLNAMRDANHLLVGRDADRSAFRRDVDQFKLVLLTGTSGVGKTSLLEVGLVPELREQGYLVAVCRDWSDGGTDIDPVDFLASKVRAALEQADRDEIQPLPPDLGTGASLFWSLDSAVAPCALVLDQFEELIRDDKHLATALFDLLLEINRRTDLRLVVSFRSEFRHELRELEAGARPFTISHYALEPVADTFARQVIDAANRGGPTAITDKAGGLLAGLWLQARESDRTVAGTGAVGLGLLHLQALLYALNHDAGGGTIEVGHVEAALGGGSSLELFHNGMERAIQVKLDRCRDACAAIDGSIDEYLVEGTADLLARAVVHLSSSGYKLVREAIDLIRITLDDDLGNLEDGLKVARSDPKALPDGPLSDGQLSAMVQILLGNQGVSNDDGPLDLLTADRTALAAAADRAALAAADRAAAGARGVGVGWSDRLHPGAPQKVVDPRTVTAGPMSGLAPAAVLIEELRRIAFALVWLDAASLVRITAPGGGATMVALVHDGFGSALERWSEAARHGPAGPLHAITAPKGASYEWSEVDGLWPQFDGTLAAAGCRLLANVRWQGAFVSARFRQVMFVNCDLRGTLFMGCEFEGVSFVNCLLDGVIFSNCAIVGAPSVAASWDPRAPQYVIDDSESIAGVFGAYQGIDGDHLVLESPVPDLPVRVVDRPEARGRAMAGEPGGVVVYGARISTVVIRSCSFVGADACMAFRNVAGSGLDIVEQLGGTFEVVGSTLRHLSLTGQGTAAEGRASMQVDATGCALAQVWISADVSGSFGFDDCTLVQIWNDSDDLEVTARASSFHGLVDVAVDDSGPLQPGEVVFSRSAIDPDGVFSRKARRMDYRRNPSEVLLEGDDGEGGGS